MTIKPSFGLVANSHIPREPVRDWIVGAIRIPQQYVSPFKGLFTRLNDPYLKMGLISGT